MNGRKKEAARIVKANKAAAIVRLMDGQINEWQEFLQDESMKLEHTFRRIIKHGHSDVKKRLSLDIKRFCNSNFLDMTEDKLVEIYENVKSLQGLEMPLNEFQKKFGQFRHQVLNDVPRHSTVKISLWGLGFQFPEKELVDDVTTSLISARQSDRDLKQYKNKNHSDVRIYKNNIADCIRKNCVIRG